MWRKVSWAMVATLTLILAACASQRPFMTPFQSYSGPARPATEYATVFTAPYGPAGYEGLHGFIDGVNGRRITLTRAAPLEVYVLPGEHRFDMVSGDGQSRRADGVVTIAAEAGHTYEIVARRVGADHVQWFVLDRSTGFRRSDVVYQEALRAGYVTERAQ